MGTYTINTKGDCEVCGKKLGKVNEWVDVVNVNGKQGHKKCLLPDF